MSRLTKSTKEQFIKNIIAAWDKKVDFTKRHNDLLDSIEQFIHDYVDEKFEQAGMRLAEFKDVARRAGVGLYGRHLPDITSEDTTRVQVQAKDPAIKGLTFLRWSGTVRLEIGLKTTVLLDSIVVSEAQQTKWIKALLVLADEKNKYEEQVTTAVMALRTVKQVQELMPELVSLLPESERPKQLPVKASDYTKIVDSVTPLD